MAMIPTGKEPMPPVLGVLMKYVRDPDVRDAVAAAYLAHEVLLAAQLVVDNAPDMPSVTAAELRAQGWTDDEMADHLGGPGPWLQLFVDLNDWMTSVTSNMRRPTS